MLIDFKDEDFHSKVKNEEVSVLQFSASWCQPCKILKPIMEKLSEEYKDKVDKETIDKIQKEIILNILTNPLSLIIIVYYICRY